MKRAVTMQQIADTVGVSKATVSMILNGTEASFSAEVVKKVKSAAISMGYRKPVTGSSDAFYGNSILIVNPNIHNLFFPTLIQYVENAARERGFETAIYNTYRDPRRETSLVSMLMTSGKWRGVIYTYAPSNLKDIEHLNKVIPTVIIGEFNIDADINTIGVDYYKAGCMVAKHLIETGHKTAAFISTSIGPHNLFRAKRWQGIRDIFEAAGNDYRLVSKIAKPSEQVELRFMHLEHETGYNLAREALLEEPGITALIGVNDQVAYGIIDYIRSNGFKIPEDYSVCGFDNVIHTPFYDITLTTVEPASRERGISAVDIISEELSRRTEQSDIYYTKVEHQNRFIAGSSTGVPRTENRK